MAVKTYLVDDLDDSDAAETIAFALDGSTYEIDLNEQHAAELREALEPFIDAGRRTSGSGRRKKAEANLPKPKLSVAGRTPARRDKEQLRAIREWAADNGYTVSARGRVPEAVAEAFEAAHSA